jgi:hypothetical protein
MKLTVLEFAGSPDDSSTRPGPSWRCSRFGDEAARVTTRDAGSEIDPDADDAAAQIAGAEAAAIPAPPGPDVVPDVAIEGQATVRMQLSKNLAADLSSSSWLRRRRGRRSSCRHQGQGIEARCSARLRPLPPGAKVLPPAGRIRPRVASQKLGQAAARL